MVRVRITISSPTRLMASCQSNLFWPRGIKRQKRLLFTCLGLVNITCPIDTPGYFCFSLINFYYGKSVSVGFTGVQVVFVKNLTSSFVEISGSDKLN